jgi:hypothetical protein
MYTLPETATSREAVAEPGVSGLLVSIVRKVRGVQFQEVQEGLRIITGLGRRTTARDRGRGRKLRRHRRADMRSSGEVGFETLSLRDLPVEVGEELPADKGLLCVKV